MRPVSRLLTAALLPILTACTVLPTPPLLPTLVHTITPNPTLTPTHTPTLTSPPTHTPTAAHTPTSTHTPTPIPTPTSPTSPIRTPVPDTDRVSMDTLLIEPPPRPFERVVVNAEPPRLVPNAIRSFWVTDGTTGNYREISARLRVQTEHTAMWVEEGIWHDVRQLEEAATLFETQIYTITRAAFGSEWMPGVDNDPHILILHAAGLGEGVLGYVSSANEFPRAVHPFSNQAEMIVVNADYMPPNAVTGAQEGSGDQTYHALLACQFQRLIQWTHDRNEERWLKEGLAELAARLNGLDPGRLERAYLEHPDTTLTTWEDAETAAQRGAVYLFATYFHERFGDEGTRALVAQPLNGTAGFDAALAELDASCNFEDLFADWLVANYVDEDSPQGMKASPHGYITMDPEAPAPAAIYKDYPVTAELSVRQFGADYILLRGDDDLRVRFTGATMTPLLNLLPHSGRYFWWSNRADESLTTLSRAFDLSNVRQATLTHWTWYDMEADYDYATVEISTDGGKQWQMLSVPSGTDENPHGNNPGWGYTGSSGNPPGWIQETVDLSPYAGEEVQVRFAYLTDEAITGVGLVLDDIAIPEIGYADDAEIAETGDGSWEPAGFLRSNNLIPQRYLALLIGVGTESGDEITVERLPVKEDQTAEWTVPLGSEGWHEAVLVLSGLAPLTAHPALYHLTIEK